MIDKGIKKPHKLNEQQKTYQDYIATTLEPTSITLTSKLIDQNKNKITLTDYHD